MQKKETFDSKMAGQCAKAFSHSCNVGCIVSDTEGNVKSKAGYSCADCGICAAAGHSLSDCLNAQNYGMNEAERFGGKYIYFCPMGLTCFVSPILGIDGAEARMTVGPFLMVGRQDYVSFDLKKRMKLNEKKISEIEVILKKVPYIPVEKVNSMSLLLFMSVGFLNNVSAANRMIETQGADNMQGQVTAYIQQIKGSDENRRYPLETEQALLRAVRQANKEEAEKLLNELLGHILLSSASNFSMCKVQIYELLVMMSRTAASVGVDPDETLKASHRYLSEINALKDFDELCHWLTKKMGNLMDSVFDFNKMRHANIVHQTVQYINTHYNEKITLDSLSYQVYLSPTYLSRIFKEETGSTVTEYTTSVRIDRSKELLRTKALSIADIAQMVGFEDQSYFSRIFKKTAGISPMAYREKHSKE